MSNLILMKVKRLLFGVLFLSCFAFAQKGSPSSPFDPGTYDPSTHLYRNRALALTLKVPYGWVDRTKQMNPDSPDPAKGSVLLAVFERPPEASNSSLDPTILIAAEPVSSYPGLKTAGDYYAPLKEVASAKGLEPAGEPYDFSVGSRRLLRADFTHKTDQGATYQSTVVFLVRGNIVSITAIAASEDDATQLLSGLNFTASAHP
jgi:hypothetical protein